MESGNLLVSADALGGSLLALLYAAVGAFAFWRLLPRLSRAGKLLAIVYLLAQLAVVLLSFVERPAHSFDWWLWNLDREYNIAATLASMQLSLVGFAALLVAWTARRRARWQRLFYAGLAILFVFLAADEFYLFHEDDEAGFALAYAGLGLTAAALTLLVAARSGIRERRWHLSFLIGLALSAFGAFGIDKALYACDQWAFLRLDKCLYLVPLEEACELLGIWLALLAMLGVLSERAMSKRILRALLAWSLVWLLLLFLWSFAPRLEQSLWSTRAEAEFASGTRLQGYRIEKREGDILAHLFAEAHQADYPWLGYTVVLVDQVTGAELARRDRFSRGQLLWYMGAGWRSLYRETVQVLLPPDLPQNRAYWIALTQWRERDGLYATQALERSDLPSLSGMQLVLGEYLRPDMQSAAAGPPLAKFSNGYHLMSADLPSSAKAGDGLPITFAWQSDAEGTEDLIQFLHLGHSESGEWWVYDQEPLGARLPTRLWYAGLADSETWTVPLPEDLAAGEYHAFTGLYRHSDKERLAVADAAGEAWADRRVALGSITMEA